MDDFEIEYADFKCRTCNVGVMLLLVLGHPIEEYVGELGHLGHDWNVETYAPKKTAGMLKLLALFWAIALTGCTPELASYPSAQALGIKSGLYLPAEGLPESFEAVKGKGER